MNRMRYGLLSLVILALLVNVGFAANIAVLTASTNCTGASITDYATNTTEIQEAIDAAAQGDVVLICGNSSPNSYVVHTAPFFVNKSGITISGLNASRIILVPVTATGGLGNGTITINGSVEFRNITFANSSGSNTVYIQIQTNNSAVPAGGMINFTNVTFLNNSLSVRIINSSNISFSGVVFENGTNSLRIDNGSTGINISLVNFTNVTGPVVANNSRATLTGNVRIINSSSNGLFKTAEVYSGGILTTSGGSNITTNHLTFTFSNLANLSIETDFTTGTGVSATQCGSSLYTTCVLMAELFRGSNNTASPRLDSLTIFYNISKITGGTSEADVQGGQWGDAGWSLVSRNSIDQDGNSVSFGPLSAFSYYGAVGFILAPAAGEVGTSSVRTTTLSEPEFVCPDNTATLTLTSGGSGVEDATIKLLDDKTDVTAATGETDSDGEVTFTLSKSGTYRTKTFVPSGYLDPDEQTFDFDLCGGAAAAPAPAPLPAPAPSPEPSPEPAPAPSPAPSPGPTVIPAPTPAPTPAPAPTPTSAPRPPAATPAPAPPATPTVAGGEGVGAVAIIGVVVLVVLVLAGIYLYMRGGKK